MHFCVSKGADLPLLKADLVIDAMGRGSLSKSWLSSLEFSSPREIVIDADIAYADW
jgi:hypothetical protein